MVLSAHQTKTATLVLSLALLVMSFFDAPSACMLQHGCSITGRLCYHFFHANFFHTLCNAWCLLALVFYYNADGLELLLSYAIATTVPSVALSTQPTVGASGICFALMGIVFYKVARKRYYLAWIIPVIAVGFFIPRMAATVHLYCFLVGLIVGVSIVNVLRRKHGVQKK